ncbi:MAG: alanine racemase [Ruminococcaceae bacterium]|nr:alanine racemase [Oscillospiraceae bacterium]
MKTYVVDTAALAENARIVRETAAPAAVWAVVKGDGYGLGVRKFAKLLKKQGYSHFAVTETREAEILRENGFEHEQILMLRATCEESELEQLVLLNVICNIGSLQEAETLNAVATRLGKAAEAHISLDTGMGRYGFLPDALDDVVRVHREYPMLAITGTFTHFSCAFCSRKKTEQQYARFQAALKELTARGVNPGEVHCANSSTLFRHPEMRCDSVRVGSALLGRLAIRTKPTLKKIGWIEASVEQVRQLPAGWDVGYGAGYTTKKPTTVAIIGVGYYHGFGAQMGQDLFRFSDIVRGCLSQLKALVTRKKLYVTIENRRCPVLGHVGMLHVVADVTGFDVSVGDIARLEANPLYIKGLGIEYR